MRTLKDWKNLCLKAAKFLGDVKQNIKRNQIFYKDGLAWHANKIVWYDEENQRLWPSYLRDHSELFSLQCRMPEYVMARFDHHTRSTTDRTEHTLSTGWCMEDGVWQVGYMRWGRGGILVDKYEQSWAFDQEHEDLGKAFVLLAAELYDNCIEPGGPK